MFRTCSDGMIQNGIVLISQYQAGLLWAAVQVSSHTRTGGPSPRLGSTAWAGWRCGRRFLDASTGQGGGPGHTTRRRPERALPRWRKGTAGDALRPSLCRKARSLASPGGKLRATGGAFEGSALLGAVDLLDDLYGKMIPTIDQGGIMCYM